MRRLTDEEVETVIQEGYEQVLGRLAEWRMKIAEDQITERRARRFLAVEGEVEEVEDVTAEVREFRERLRNYMDIGVEGIRAGVMPAMRVMGRMCADGEQPNQCPVCLSKEEEDEGSVLW